MNNLKENTTNNLTPPEESQQAERDKIYNLYVVENLSQKEVGERLGLTECQVSKRVVKYNIVKSKSLIAECTRRRNLELYGVDNLSKLDTSKQKARQTNIERYGVPASSQSLATKEKQAATNTARYGGVSPLTNKIIRQKTEKTMKEKYGVEKPAQNPDIMKKIQETNLQKYGKQYAFATDNCVKKTAAKKSHYSQKTLDILYNEDQFIAFVKTHPAQTIKELAALLGCYPSSISLKVRKYNAYEYVNIKHTSVSSYEAEIERLLFSWGVSCERNKTGLLSDNKEIDIYCSKQHIGIEFNGTYWHSELYKDKDYHLKKSLDAEAHGIRLIHIYEYEWNDPAQKEKIISLLKITFGVYPRRIYARKCEIRQISNEEAKPFNDANHLQGHRSALITYGLFYENELVQLMSFSHHSKYEWEIVRGCPGSNNITIGGVSKLFTHFLKQYQPHQVFSYCDFNKFNGTSYEALHMKLLGYTSPDKTWIINKKGFKRSPYHYQEYKQGAETIVWGAGSKRYLWSKNLVGSEQIASIINVKDEGEE